MKGDNYVTVVFGSDQIRKLHNEQALTEEEVNQFVKTYSFKTKAELKAFILGIEEAQGWLEIIYFEGIKVATNTFAAPALGIEEGEREKVKVTGELRKGLLTTLIYFSRSS